jgi:hypothetical protein
MICACMPVVAVLFTRSFNKLRAVVLRRRTRETDSIGGAVEKPKKISPWPSVPRATMTGMRTFIRGGRRSSSAAGMTTLAESTYYDGSVSMPVDDVELGHAAAKEKKEKASSDQASWYVRKGLKRHIRSCYFSHHHNSYCSFPFLYFYHFS